MPRQKFHVLQHKCLWLLCFKNTGYFKEKSPSGVLESFSLSDDTKRLAGESGQKNVVVGDGFGVNGVYVASRRLSEIGLVSLLAIRINVAGQDTLGVDADFLRNLFYGIAKAAYATK